MRATPRRYALLLALTLLVALGAALPGHALAQGPSVTIFAPEGGVGLCPPNGRQVAAGPQASAFRISLANFPAAPVFVLVTFPDGRVFDFNTAAELLAPGGTYATPLAFPSFPPPAALAAPVASGPPLFDPVDASLSIQTALNWPTGCYRVRVVSAAPPPSGAPLGPSPTVRASSDFLLQPFTFPAQPANLQLSAQRTGTLQPTGTQPLLVAPLVAISVFGRGPLAPPPDHLPAINVIRPDGAILSTATVTATGSPGGFMVPPLTLPANSLFGTGAYTIVASTPAMTPTSSTRAQFTLSAPPSVPVGNAVLTMSPFSGLVPAADPWAATPPQITIAGRNLPPGAVTPVLVLPNGGRIVGPNHTVNGSGNLPAFTLALSRIFPTGAYRLEVVQPGATPSLLASISWRVDP